MLIDYYCLRILCCFSSSTNNEILTSIQRITHIYTIPNGLSADVRLFASDYRTIGPTINSHEHPAALYAPPAVMYAPPAVMYAPPAVMYALLAVVLT